MGKFLTILFTIVTLMQISLQSNAASVSDTLITKRHNLLKKTFSDLRKAIWQDETFEYSEDFMKNIKQWSNSVTDENFQKSEFQSQIDVATNLLSTLRADPGNCDIHRNLVQSYLKIRELSPKNNNEFEKYKNDFMGKIEKVFRKEKDNLYLKLNEELEVFISDLNDVEKGHASDIINWYDIFNSEEDVYMKQHMALDFPRLFPKEQLDTDTTCLPKEVTDSIN